jgi:hypothetical protein
MFDRLLQTALDTGGEVIVQTRYDCDGVKGRVLDFDGKHFSVFHSGTGGGMLWVFRLIDVAYCGLVLELPTPLKELSEPSLPLCNSLNTLPSGDSLDKVPPCSHPPEEGE